MIRTSHRALFAILALATLTLALLLGPGRAHAVTVNLRADITAPDGNLTLGDLFENAGAAAAVVVATGGQNGGSLVLNANSLQRLAADHGLEWANARNFNRLIARVEPTGGRTGGAPVVAVSGRRATVTGEALVYARDFTAGDIVGAEDIVWATPTGYGTPIDTPRDSRRVIGQAVRRPIRAGAAVSLADLAAPKVIKRDDVVQVAYAAGGIRLVLQGKAMASAAMGETIDILNPSSKKIIQAVAVGPDEAVVGPEAERAKAITSDPRLFASLN